MSRYHVQLTSHLYLIYLFNSFIEDHSGLSLSPFTDSVFVCPRAKISYAHVQTILSVSRNFSSIGLLIFLSNAFVTDIIFISATLVPNSHIATQHFDPVLCLLYRPFFLIPAHFMKAF